VYVHVEKETDAGLIVSGPESRLRWSSIGYWMISSARPNTDCGIVRPRAFAVFRLITSSNLVIA